MRTAGDQRTRFETAAPGAISFTVFTVDVPPGLAEYQSVTSPEGLTLTSPDGLAVVNIFGSWNEADWIHLPRRVAALIAPLVGARADDALHFTETLDGFAVDANHPVARQEAGLVQPPHRAPGPAGQWR